jgi:glycosyltransferase A (GT-A) superfamily protein (DUF2064 family)
MGEVTVCFDPPEARGAFEDLLADFAPVVFLPQTTGDLGHRLAAASQQYDRVLFLGADSPDVPQPHLETALRLTAEADVCLGPTGDGGYWCLGLGQRVEAGRLLSNIPWSSGKELAATCSRARELGYDVRMASLWPDVDRAADLERMLHRLAASEDGEDRRLLERLQSVLKV